MGKFALVVLSVLVIVELILIIGIAGVLFWFGGRGTILVGSAMVLIGLVACVLAVRTMRPRR
jgi:hypothetical protein